MFYMLMSYLTRSRICVWRNKYETDLFMNLCALAHSLMNKDGTIWK